MVNSTPKIEAGDEYITVAGVDTPLHGLVGTREMRGNRPYFLLPDGSLSYRIKVCQALPFTKRRQIEMDKADSLARVRESAPARWTSMADMMADWK